MKKTITNFNLKAKILLQVWLILFVCIGANAQIDFGTAVGYLTGTSPQSVTIADFNGDGYKDFVTPNKNTNNVSIGLGLGNGSFTVTSINGGSSPREAVAEDFNNDGYKDIVIVNFGGNNINILTGTGAGFGNGNYYPVGSNPSSISKGDFNGDGKTDIVVANSGENTISVLTGTGTGHFANSLLITTSSNYPNSVRTSDFNNDGITDLIVTYKYSTTIGVLTGTGFGGFGLEKVSNTTNALRDVAMLDFNGDGNMDLILNNQYYVDGIDVFTGSGTGFFGAVANIANIGTVSGIATYDFNNDGNKDFVMSNGSYIKVFTSLGIGSFGEMAINYNITGASFLTESNGIVVEDFNNDGKVDLMISVATSNRVVVLLQSSNNVPFISSFAPTIVLPGQTITINGSLLGSTTGISFAGGVSTAPLSVSANKVITSVPSGALSGLITLTGASSLAKSDSILTITTNVTSIDIFPPIVTIPGTFSELFSTYILPVNTPDKSVTWSISPSNLGSILSDGTFTAGSIPGAVLITATSNSNASVTGSRLVTIVGIPVSSISVSPGFTTLTGGNSTQFTADVQPLFATLKSVTWSLSPSVGSIASDGTYTAPATFTGIVTITATSVSDPSVSDATVVSVFENISVTSISLSPAYATIVQGNSFQIIDSLNPSNATNKNVTWSVDPPYLGSVSSDGTFTATSITTLTGVVTITATSVSNPTIKGMALVDVTAPIAVTSIVVSDSSGAIFVGTNAYFIANILPTNASNMSVTWMSSNTLVGIIDVSGVFTGVSAGTTTITATSISNSAILGSIEVIVNSIDGINVTPSTLIISGGSNQQFTAHVLPSNTITSNVTWSVDPSNLAYISNTGLLTSGSISGVVTVTATLVSNPFVYNKAEVLIVGTENLEQYFVSIVNISSQTIFVNGNTIVSWPTLAGMSSYCIQYSTDSTFTTGVVTVCGLTDPTYTITGTGSSSGRTSGALTIYWKAGALNSASGLTYWSHIQHTANVLEIATPTLIDQLQLYPNPASDLIHISGLKANDEVLIYDVHGTLVLKTSAFAIDISSLSNGIYVARINAKSLRFVKQ